MKTIKQIIWVLTACCITSLSGCKKHAKERYADGVFAYERVLKKELEREEQFDSIFYGIHLKMTQGKFHDHCNEMHKIGLFDGNENYEIFIKMSEGFNRPVNMVFSPLFNEPFIKVLKVRFSYDNVSVFDKQGGSGILIEEVVKEMNKWYGGNDFITIPPKYPYERPSYIKIDGNRKITLKESDSYREVIGIYEDLRPLY